MATKAQIDKLAQRIELLARPQRYEGKAAMVIVDRESEEAALERHCRAHPEDRGASRLVFLKIVYPKVMNERRRQGDGHSFPNRTHRATY